MNRIRRVAVLAISAVACVALGSANNAGAQAPAGQDTGGKQPYTMPEYNAEQACGADKNPTSQVKCLDDFVSKYPNSNLLPFVYPMYFQAYTQMKNWPKVIESADKALALGDKLEPAVRYQADFARAVAYSPAFSAAFASSINSRWVERSGAAVAVLAACVGGDD